MTCLHMSLRRRGEGGSDNCRLSPFKEMGHMVCLYSVSLKRRIEFIYMTYLPPFVGFWSVVFKSQQSSPHHVQPVYVNYISSSCSFVTKYTAEKEKNSYDMRGVSLLLTLVFLQRDRDRDPRTPPCTPRTTKPQSGTWCPTSHQVCTRT